MKKLEYIYHVNFQSFEEPLCGLEQRSVFGIKDLKRTFRSPVCFEPSHSPFMKSRLDISIESDSFDGLMGQLEAMSIKVDDFIVMYMVYDKEDPHYSGRKALCKKVGMAIKGYPNFKEPKFVFGISCIESKWFFGRVYINEGTWRKHNNRPYSYSSSLGVHMAKAIVNIGTRGKLEKKIIDPCCGVGTVLLEAAYAGYVCEGIEIISKVGKSAQMNMAFYDYKVPIMIGDMTKVTSHYDVGLLDLPYGISTDISHIQQEEIIIRAAQLVDRLVVVSIEDISQLIMDREFKLVDSCSVRKNYGIDFFRHVWVIES